MSYPGYLTGGFEADDSKPEPTVYVEGSAAVVVANAVAAAAVDAVGSLCWAALVVLYVLAQISAH